MTGKSTKQFHFKIICGGKCHCQALSDYLHSAFTLIHIGNTWYCTPFTVLLSKKIFLHHSLKIINVKYVFLLFFFMEMYINYKGVCSQGCVKEMVEACSQHRCLQDIYIWPDVFPFGFRILEILHLCINIYFSKIQICYEWNKRRLLLLLFSICNYMFSCWLY